MKLRNKKTGEVADLSIFGIELNIRKENQPIYHSLAELNEEWEDYKPKEPLIKDELARKAIRAWAEANSLRCDDKVEVSTPIIDCCILGLLHGFTSIDLIIDGEVTLKNHGRYTIDELCGDSEEAE